MPQLGRRGVRFSESFSFSCWLVFFGFANGADGLQVV
jgi:hypothetical protein